MRQLHVFTDASEVGFGTVAYVRTVDGFGNCDASFVMAKSSVAPLVFHSMLRLELQGAITGPSTTKAIDRRGNLLERLEGHAPLEKLQIYSVCRE